MKNDWPVKMTKTREEMNALDLPWGGGEALVLQDKVTDQTRWSTIHELTFRLAEMPDFLAYRTTYSKGSTEYQDERPWEHSPAECVLVQRVPQITEVWVPASEKPNVRKSLLTSTRALAGRKVLDFAPEWNVNAGNLMAAENMTPEWHQRLADNVGQRVRLTRVVTYEGDNTAVLQTVAASLQPGKSYGSGTYTVSVREAGYGRVEDLEQPCRVGSTREGTCRTYVEASREVQIRNNIFRACLEERERQIEKGYDAAHDDDHADGDLSGLAAAVASGDPNVAHPLLRASAEHILTKWPGYRDRIRIAHAILTADLERLARAAGQPEKRIEVARVDPTVLIGIAPCDDGSPGWVVLAAKPDPNDPESFIVASLADEADPLGEIVYVDILDAAEVLKTGIVWKHDMGDGEADAE